jgi:hypothetical protein
VAKRGAQAATNKDDDEAHGLTLHWAQTQVVEQR